MTADIWDVVIVGAGLSGLSAAHLLTKRDAKLRILILEGKGRELCILQKSEALKCGVYFMIACVSCQIEWEVAPCPLKSQQPTVLIAGTLEDSGSEGN